VLTSPSLYEGQVVKASLRAGADAPVLRFFVEYFDGDDQIQRLDGESFALTEGENALTWQIPSLDGHMIYRLGIELSSDVRRDGTVLLRTLDWSGAPVRFRMGKSYELTPSVTPWTTQTTWIKAFMRSAEQFYPDYTTTFSASHPTENGVATIGSRDWLDYSVTSTLTLAQQECAGLVARSRGHRRYYAAVLRDGCAVIEKRMDGQITDLARVPYPYEIDRIYTLKFSLLGSKLWMEVDGVKVAEAEDDTYPSGGAGFIVESGAMLADEFIVERLED